MTTNKIAPEARNGEYELSWTTRLGTRDYDLATGRYPDNSMDLAHLPSGDKIDILARQFPEELRGKVYFVVLHREDRELWAEAIDYNGRTVFAGQLADEPMVYYDLVVRRAKVSDEFIAAVALML